MAEHKDWPIADWSFIAFSTEHKPYGWFYWDGKETTVTIEKYWLRNVNELVNRTILPGCK